MNDDYNKKRERIEYERRMEILQKDVDARRITEIQEVLLKREMDQTRRMKQIDEMQRSQRIKRFLSIPKETQVGIPNSVQIVHDYDNTLRRQLQEDTNRVLRR